MLELKLQSHNFPTTGHSYLSLHVKTFALTLICIYGWSYHNIYLFRNTKWIFSPLLKISRHANSWLPVFFFVFFSLQVSYICISFGEIKRPKARSVYLGGKLSTVLVNVRVLGVYCILSVQGPLLPDLPATRHIPLARLNWALGPKPRSGGSSELTPETTFLSNHVGCWPDLESGKPQKTGSLQNKSSKGRKQIGVA